MQNEIEIIIDNYLNYLKVNKSNSSIFAVQERHNALGQEAIRIMLEHNLISMRNPSSQNSIVDITSNGLSVLDSGGIGKFLNDICIKKKKKQLIEDEKLKYDLANSKRIYKTYWFTFGFALAAFLISLFNLYKSLTK